MKRTVDYSKSASPRADALQDVIEELGERWDSAKKFGLQFVKDTEQFTNWAGFAGIEGAPVEAWYDHYHGQGAWEIATGWSHFDKRNEFHPAKVIREHTNQLTAYVRREMEVANLGRDHTGESSVLDILDRDELAAVEEWLQRCAEFTTEAEAALDRKWKEHIHEVERHLIQRMVDKVEAQRRGTPNEAGRYILENLKLNQLNTVVSFLESYLVRV